MRRSARRAAIGLVMLVFGVILGVIGVRLWLVEQDIRPAAHVHYPLMASDKSLGVTVDLVSLDRDARQDALAQMRSAGFVWVRQRFAWDAIEPRRGGYEWAVWDEMVHDVEASGLRLLAVLDGSPGWARRSEDGDNRLSPPAETRDFGAFAAALSDRYDGQINHFQIWDEPNIAPHWGNREIDVGGYARLLREGAIQIRAVQPDAVILLAALAPNVEAGGANMSDVLFLDELYRQGAAQWFDLVPAQIYDFGQPLRSEPDPIVLNWRRVELLREIMERHQDSDAALWAVSCGLSSSASVEESLDMARGEWPWLGPVLWAAWSPSDQQGHHALVDRDGLPTDTYQALASLGQEPAVAWPGRYSANHASGLYEGEWRVTSLGADIGASGDRLVIPFRGDRIDLTVRRGNYRAFLFVSVDGAPANRLPHDSEGRAYVVLYDPLAEEATLTLASGLIDGPHTVEITAERGWGQWALVGWTVAGEGSEGTRAWILAAVLSLVGVSGAVVYAWPARTWIWNAAVRCIARSVVLDDWVFIGLVAATSLALYIIPGAMASLCLLGILVLLLFLRPKSSLPVLVFALPAYQCSKPLLGKVFSMTEILVLAAAVGWGGRQLFQLLLDRSRSQKPGFRLSVIDWSVLALVLVAALTILWADHGREAAREFRTVVLEAGIFYGLLRALIRTQEDAKIVVAAWLAGGAAIALVAVAQWVFDANIIQAEGVRRVRGFYGSPNNLALYLVRVFPVGVALAVFDAKRRWLSTGLVVVMALGLVLTYSRGAWLLGVPAALLFGAIASGRNRRGLLLSVGATAVVAIAVLLVLGPGRLTSLLDAGQGTTFFRLSLWKSSWAMVRDHPVLGVGLDNFLYHYRTYYVLPTAWEEFNLSHPHNLVLDFWLRLGLPGLLLLGVLLVSFFRSGWRAYRQFRSEWWGFVILGVMGGMAAFVAHGLVDNAFFLVDLAYVFMLMLALVQVRQTRLDISLEEE